MAIALLPDLVLPMRKISSQQPPSWYLSITYQHLEVPRVTSGGSRRRECPLPKKLPPFGHGPRDFWAKPKSCGYFSGAPPSIPPCGFAVLVIPGKKAGFAPTEAVCRSCTTMPVSIRAPPPGGETGTVFPALKYSAPAPCRSGCRGEAPCSLQRSEIPDTGWVRGDYLSTTRL